ncbi:MAG TPA: hypothetical protein VK612_12820 [Pyrinomonadaceae bacterium]|nr:hypothetical protein [Pyrinomonadaceae bacterium]
MNKPCPRILFFLVLVLFAVSISAQKRATKTVTQKAAKSLIVAVLNDGKTAEPIAYLQNGKLTEPANGSDDQAIIAAFNKAYYPIGKVYPLYFGGKASGTVTVKSSDSKRECSANMADVTTKTTRSTLKGNVMAIATNAPLKTPGSGVRRLPTAAERAEIEALVRDKFVENNISAAVAKNLKYHNLTALDVDGDGKVEFVGSFWVDTTATSRGLLFFIAEIGDDGKYKFGHSEFSNVLQKDTMSEDIKDLDTGVYHERLLDIFDTDGDGVGEVFTYVMSFEGSGFNVYKRQATGWTAIFEGSNYHCGY